MILTVPVILAQTNEHKLTITWEHNGLRTDGYILEKTNLSTDEVQLIQIEDETLREYVDNDISLDIGYKYRMQAFNETGKSDFSNSASGIVFSIPDVPSIKSVKLEN